MPNLGIFTGNANPNLARDVAAYLDVAVGKALSLSEAWPSAVS